MSNFASIFITTVALLSLTGYIALLVITGKLKPGEKIGADMGHEWDGIKEFNNPLPKWWFWTFLGCIIWGFGFAFYYPALGNYAGLSEWTSAKRYDEEVKNTNKKYDEYFAAITKSNIDEMADDQRVLRTGRRLFLNNCAVCHGSAASGSQGYPNLTDKDWLWGGEPETILQSIANGRTGVMPPQRDSIMAIAKSQGLNTDTAVEDTIEYTLSLSGNGSANENGQKIFSMVCSACHMPDGTGMKALGAPDLTDNIWLYDTGEKSRESLYSLVELNINEGRSGVMPPHKEILTEEKIKTLAAYVYSLSK